MATPMNGKANIQPIRTVNIRGKEYVDVAERVRLCNADEGFSMAAQERYQLGNRWFFSVYIEVKGRYYYGDAEIKFDAKPGTPDGTNPIECAQTSALGRALGFAGYGALESIASANEVIAAITPSLDDMIKRVKKRAMALNVAHNSEEWQRLLQDLHVDNIDTDALDVITTYLNTKDQQGA